MEHLPADSATVAAFWRVRFALANALSFRGALAAESAGGSVWRHSVATGALLVDCDYGSPIVCLVYARDLSVANPHFIALLLIQEQETKFLEKCG